MPKEEELMADQEDSDISADQLGQALAAEKKLMETPRATQPEPFSALPRCNTVEKINTPAHLVAMAITQNLDIDKLEKLLEMQIKWEALEAKKAYDVAMAAFKAKPVEISKDKNVRYETSKGTTNYMHATLGNVAAKLGTALSKHLLSATWKMEQKDKDVTVTCTIAHAMGHSESTSLTAGHDVTGSKNAIQAIGSTVTYLQRYTLLALTGTATHDQDDDGKGSDSASVISEEQVNELYELVKNVKADKALFLKFMGAETIEDILTKDFSKAKASLKAKAKGANKKP